MSSNTMKTSRETARRFLVTRHLLAPARSLTGGIDGVLEVFRRLGSVQFDPLAVAGRNHDLVLHARVSGYDPAWCEELLYSRRALFETQNKGLSLLPIDELPWYRVSWTQSRHAAGVLTDNAELADQVLKRIRSEGPLSALDFESGRTVNWFGGSMSLASAVLDAFATTGVLGLARREGNRRYYDLAERLFPRRLLTVEVPKHEQFRHKLLSRFRAHGLLGVSSPAMIGIGPAKPDPQRPDRPSRTELREELIARGEIVPVEIEGVRGTRFVLRDEVELLRAPPDPPPSVSFLPPLDPLCWDPDFLQKLWDFQYVWEVYIPEAKRRWGYYVLPVLFRDRLVGRIEPRIERRKDRVRVLGLNWEQGFDPAIEEGFVEAMREALVAYLRFGKVTQLEWGPNLVKERNLFQCAA
ncbi:MAG TPA: crosslink repair DNA glycosylase YcaQ family protein [Chloroflexota bacterium]|nr:crosslink repair DNA glycosylase YcaQ family protein [Chloroflexota bacterium]